MQDNFRITFTPSSTGIYIEATTRGGNVIATRELSAAKMRAWVADHSDRAMARSFDTAIDAAIDRTEPYLNPKGNLAGILECFAKEFGCHFDARARLVNDMSEAEEQNLMDAGRGHLTRSYWDGVALRVAAEREFVPRPPLNNDDEHDGA